MPFVRDPVSELFDAPARKLLRRAYASPGEWQATRLAHPGGRHLAWGLANGINLLGRDNASTASGRHLDMRSRWGRAFARAVFYQNRWYFARGELRSRHRATPNLSRSVEVRVGRALPRAGLVPAGRMVMVRVHAGGRSRAVDAVRALPDSARIYDESGRPAGRWGDPAGRDW